jgi:uncharacterized phage infection (PIP) family protein YhgE
MPRFRLLLIVLFLTALAGTVWIKRNQVSQLWNFSYCEQPLTYSIGELDSRFGLTPAEFTAVASQAAQIWNKAGQKTLITQVSSSAAQVSVNFVFDGKQDINTHITTQQSQVEKDQALLAQQRATYQQQLADFTKRAQAFGQKVQAVNAAGGAKDDEYTALTTQQKQLQEEADRLNAQGKQLNMSLGQFNTQVAHLNNSIDLFNQELTKRPEEGLYNGQLHRIEIYLRKDPAQLTHTMAHEFGHALGLDHNANPQSIMYKTSSGSLTPSSEDTSSLREACKEYTGWEAFKLRIYDAQHLHLTNEPQN